MFCSKSERAYADEDAEAVHGFGFGFGFAVWVSIFLNATKHSNFSFIQFHRLDAYPPAHLPREAPARVGSPW